MNDKTCTQENAVVQAIRTGQWSAELREHVSQCETCAEVSQVSRFVGNVAENLGKAEPVPDPGIIWLKAQLAEQMQSEKRAIRLRILALGVGHSAIAAMLSFLIFWIWPVVNPYISRLLAWIPDAFLSPSTPYVKDPIAYLSSPILILSCLALVYFFLLPRLRIRFFR